MGHALRYRDESELPDSLRRQVESVRKKTADHALRRLSDEIERAAHDNAAVDVVPTGMPPRKPRRPRRDLEHNEQVVLINRIKALAVNDPRFALAADRTHAIPNGGGRSRAEAGRLKAEGVKSGVSDLFVALPAAAQHGLYIEMKAAKGRVSDEQRAWIERSLALGYPAHVCWSADEAFEIWRAYVESSFEA